MDYNLHIDTMDPCNPDEQWVYRQLLGIALWIVLCGRYDTAFAVNTLSAFSTALTLERTFDASLWTHRVPVEIS